MGSHSAIFSSRYNPSQISQYSTYLLQRDGRMTWP